MCATVQTKRACLCEFVYGSDFSVMTLCVCSCMCVCASVCIRHTCKLGVCTDVCPCYLRILSSHGGCPASILETDPSYSHLIGIACTPVAGPQGQTSQSFLAFCFCSASVASDLSVSQLCGSAALGRKWQTPPPSDPIFTYLSPLPNSARVNMA